MNTYKVIFTNGNSTQVDADRFVMPTRRLAAAYLRFYKGDDVVAEFRVALVAGCQLVSTNSG